MAPPDHLDADRESPTTTAEILAAPPSPRAHMGETTTNWRALGDPKIGNTEIMYSIGNPDGKMEDISQYMHVAKISAPRSQPPSPPMSPPPSPPPSPPASPVPSSDHNTESAFAEAATGSQMTNDHPPLQNTELPLQDEAATAMNVPIAKNGNENDEYEVSSDDDTPGFNIVDAGHTPPPNPASPNPQPASPRPFTLVPIAMPLFKLPATATMTDGPTEPATPKSTRFQMADAIDTIVDAETSCRAYNHMSATEQRDAETPTIQDILGAQWAENRLTEMEESDENQNDNNDNMTQNRNDDGDHDQNDDGDHDQVQHDENDDNEDTDQNQCEENTDDEIDHDDEEENEENDENDENVDGNQNQDDDDFPDDNDPNQDWSWVPDAN